MAEDSGGLGGGWFMTAKWWWLGAFLALGLGNAGAGNFQLTRIEDRYTLVASNAPLADVLRELQAFMPTALQFYGEPTQCVAGIYRALPLETLLDRLGVTYALVYAPDADGVFQVERAGVLQQGDPLRPRYPELTAEKIATVRRAIADLRDDDRPYNATHAWWELCEAGCAAVPYLEEAVRSDDLQQRQVAAQILRSCCPEYEPSDRMLAVTAELLQRSNCLYDLRFMAWPSSAFGYLRANSNAARRVEAQLRANLEGSDRQARLLSALLLAEHRHREMTPVLAPLLVPHLADNRLMNDGGLAAHALFQLGEGVRPYVEPLLESDDAQQADLARLIIHQLDHPEDTKATLTDAFFNTGISNPVIQVTEMRREWDDEDFPDSEGNYPQQEGEDDDVGDGTVVPFRYTPRPGESLETVAFKFAVSLRDLAALNGLPATPGLVITNTLNIPIME